MSTAGAAKRPDEAPVLLWPAEGEVLEEAAGENRGEWHPRAPTGNIYSCPTQPNPLSEYLAQLLGIFVRPTLSICSNVYHDSPVILLASGTAFAVNYFGPSHYPILAASSDAALEGSVALAKLVAAAFLFKSALEPFVGLIRNSKSETKISLHQKAIRYFNPLALALIVAYTRGWNVKTVEGTLYSAGLFAFMKLLGKSFDFICSRVDKSEGSYTPF